MIQYNSNKKRLSVSDLSSIEYPSAVSVAILFHPPTYSATYFWSGPSLSLSEIINWIINHPAQSSSWAPAQGFVRRLAFSGAVTGAKALYYFPATSHVSSARPKSSSTWEVLVLVQWQIGEDWCSMVPEVWCHRNSHFRMDRKTVTFCHAW